MGRRDDLLDDERADAALRRVLARLDEPAQVESPPDLVTRTARRMPPAPPALAARNAARRSAILLGMRVLIFGAAALVVALGLWGALGGEQLAMLFGDGSGGLSRAVLTLQLLAKPLLRTVGAAGGPLLAGGAVLLAASAWLWWALLRRTPVQYLEQAP